MEELAAYENFKMFFVNFEFFFFWLVLKYGGQHTREKRELYV